MKIFLWLPLYVAALMPLPFSAAAGVFRGGAEPKVSICHWNTISVGESAVPGHLAHGDLEGACDSPENCAARCNDCIECTIDSCDPAGGCVNTPDNSKCEASDVCYVGKCDPANGCVETPVAVTDPPTIDGVIEEGEWADAVTATIGNGGGTAYFKADANFIYGAFDITGWTDTMGSDSGGNLLGFGVWNADNSYPGNGVEFQQATNPASWGNDGDSGTLNELFSAFRINAQSPPASVIPDSLEAMDSFDTGHRVWEVKMPISTMTVVDCEVWAVGGINYASAQHWYPDTFFTNGYKDYMHVPLESRD